jgi:hypothetical protein
MVSTKLTLRDHEEDIFSDPGLSESRFPSAHEREGPYPTEEVGKGHRCLAVLGDDSRD